MIEFLTLIEAAAYLNISRSRFFDLKKYLPFFPKPVKKRINGSRPLFVWNKRQLDQFALRLVNYQRNK